MWKVVKNKAEEKENRIKKRYKERKKRT